jgi:hypothetical protein
MLVIRELEDPGGRDMTPFPWEDAVMPFYDGHPPPLRGGVACLT